MFWNLYIFLLIFILDYIDGVVGLKVKVLNLSDQRIPYQKAENWQKALLSNQIDLQAQISNEIVGHMLLLQHDNVYTLGTATDENSFLKSSSIETTSTTTSALDYDIFEIERGGQATYHGPGQIVMYPIIDLNKFQKDINIYLRGLEDITIQTLFDYNIPGKRRDGLTGVWVNNQKLCAIGIKLRRWVTMHGIALNVNPDMRYFDNIIPCGITDPTLSVGCMTTCRPDLHNKIEVHEVADKLRDNFAKHYNLQVEELKGSDALEYLHNVQIKFGDRNNI